MESHEWREKGADDTRYFRATHHAGKWRFQTTLKSEPDWTPIEHPDKELWLTLRDMLWRRYQRKKGAWLVIEKIDLLLEKEFGHIVDASDKA